MLHTRILTRTIYTRTILLSSIGTKSLQTCRHITTSNVGAAFCDLDAEPLRRYRIGGYHPVHLSEKLKSDRFEILHKLGWGGYSTVWLAKDRE